MSRQTEKILSLIEEQKTCNEICECLQITNKQLYHKLTNLKAKGFFLDRKYFSNGEIVYVPIYRVNDIRELKCKYILHDFHFLLIVYFVHIVFYQ